MMALGLVVEMTEHTPVEDYPKLNEAVHDLRWRGVRLAIDVKRGLGGGLIILAHDHRAGTEGGEMI